MSDEVQSFVDKAPQLTNETLGAFIDELKSNDKAVKDIFLATQISAWGTVRTTRSKILNATPWSLRNTIAEQLLLKGDPNYPPIKRLLSQRSNLEIRSVAGLEALERFTNLKSLQLHGLPIENLEKLKGSGGLTSLNIDSCAALKDLSLLASFPKLQSLNISKAGALEEVALPKLPELQHLTLSLCEKVVEFSAPAECAALNHVSLSSLPALKRVRLSGTKLVGATLSGLEIEALEALELPETLRRLDVSQCGQLVSLKGLSKCPQLSALRVSRCPKLASFEGLGAGKETLVVNVQECKGLKSLTGLEAREGLSELHVTNCGALKNLEGLARVKHAEISRSGLTSVQGVQSCAGLERLMLPSNAKLASLEGLQKVEGLQVFSAVYCAELTDLSPLEGLGELRVVLLNKSGVKRKDVKQPLRSVCTWAANFDLDKLQQRMPMRLRGNKAQPGDTATLNKLKRLLKSKDVDAIDQGLAIFEAVDHPEWFDALLEDVYYEKAHDRDAGRVVHRLRSKRFSGPTATYVTLALLARAPKTSSIAQALKEKVDKLELIGRYADKTPRTVNLADLSGVPKLELLDLRMYEVVADEVPELPNLKRLTLSGYKPLPHLKWLAKAPALEEIQLSSSCLKSLEGVRSVPVKKMMINSSNLESLDPLKGHPKLESLQLASGRTPINGGLELPELRSLSLSGLQLSSFDLLKGLDKLETLNLNSIPAKYNEELDPAPILALPSLKQVKLGWNAGVAAEPLKQKGLLDHSH